MGHLGFAIGASVTGLSLAALLLAEVRGVPWLRWVAKPMASLGFLLAALLPGWSQGSFGPEGAFGPFGNLGAFGVTLVLALVLCMAGDVLLIPARREIFMAGIAAFLLGHLAFGAAFLTRGVRPLVALVALVMLVPLGLLVWRWLRPHVSARMTIPVLSYIVVITAMVALAAGTLGHRPDGVGKAIAVAAVLFFLSDLAVARHRFVRAHFTNRLWGLPLYYGAQLIFAALVGGSH